MSIAPLRDDGDDAGNADFRALLQRPLHAIELKDSEGQSNFRSFSKRRLSGSVFSEREVNPIVSDRRNSSAPNLVPGRDVKFLSNLGAQDASQMCSVLAHQSGCISIYF